MQREMELDNPGCGIQFGAIHANLPECDVIARWICEGQQSQISICKNDYGNGTAVYMSRMNNTSELVDLLVGFIKDLQHYTWGDFNSSGSTDIDDVMALVAYIFTQGVAPDVWNSADSNGDGAVDIDDVMALVGWIFQGEDTLKGGRIEN